MDDTISFVFPCYGIIGGLMDDTISFVFPCSVA
jgi:hypothetical protein